MHLDRPPAYRVPFLFDRSGAPRYRLVNVGAERLRGVSALLQGSGVMPAIVPTALDPTEALEFTVRGDDLGHATTLVVRWLRPTGEEYLWRVAF